jgi:hypothetical protein
VAKKVTLIDLPASKILQLISFLSLSERTAKKYIGMSNSVSDPQPSETLLEQLNDHVRAVTPPGMSAECPLDLRVSKKVRLFFSLTSYASVEMGL